MGGEKIKGWTRRSVLAGAAAIGPAIIVRPTRAADYKFAQYHNQAASGTLHKNLISERALKPGLLHPVRAWSAGSFR